MHNCILGISAPLVCRPFVAFCNRMLRKELLKNFAFLRSVWNMPNGLFGPSFMRRESVLDAADFNCALWNLVIGGQLRTSAILDIFSGADDKMTGASVVLRNAATVLSNAIVDFYVHGCSPFRVVIFCVQCIREMLHCKSTASLHLGEIACYLLSVFVAMQYGFAGQM